MFCTKLHQHMEEIDRFKINYLTKPTAKRLQNNARQ